jgi:hypothetical protein
MAPTSHLLMRSGVRAIRSKPRRKAGLWERPAFFNLPAWGEVEAMGVGVDERLGTVGGP